MALITQVTNEVFDTNEIKTGDLVYARHRSWEDGRSGFVTDITSNELTVQYYPKIGRITNHFIIRADEVVRGSWEIRWSDDLTQVTEIPLI